MAAWQNPLADMLQPTLKTTFEVRGPTQLETAATTQPTTADITSKKNITTNPRNRLLDKRPAPRHPMFGKEPPMSEAMKT